MRAHARLQAQGHLLRRRDRNLRHVPIRRPRHVQTAQGPADVRPRATRVRRALMARRHRHRRGTRPLRHANHLGTRAPLPRPSPRRPGFFMPVCMTDMTRHQRPTGPAIFSRGLFISRAPSVQTRRRFHDGRLA